MSAQKIFTIAPHTPFLSTLAARVCDGSLLQDWDLSGPFALSDVTIILPTRRARLALAEAFAEQLGGGALLPDIRTFGGQPEDEEPFLPPFDAEKLPKPVTPIKRRLVLSRLVELWARAGGGPETGAGEILSLADALGELIDDCHIEDVSPATLENLAPDNLAENWQGILEFLSVALKAWPDILEERGEIDSASLRNIQLSRQAEAAKLIFGERPVIAAGSTGSIPATANLLKAITQLPRGAIVLPGLDIGLSEDELTGLRDPRANPHGHPQYGLVQLLTRLGTEPKYVDELASEPANFRTAIIRHAMVSPEQTAHWNAQREQLLPNIPDALCHVAIAVARTDEEQARAIALATYQARSENQSVGIISPDRTLARRIAAELRRFDISVDDSAGVPLYQTRIGRLARQILALVANNFASVDLVALLRSQFITFGADRAKVTSITDKLEYGLLRGQRPPPGIEGLRDVLARNLDGKLDHVPLKLTADDGMQISDLLDRLAAALSPLQALFAGQKFSAAKFVAAMEQALLAIIDPVPEAFIHRPDMRAFRDWLDAVKGEVGQGPSLMALGIDEAMRGLMAGITVRALGQTSQSVYIWGLLEARLQNPDLIILAGLSESIWPEAADPGPWMSRAMRVDAGLEPPERRQGQAAHDFQMAMGNNQVLITRAERVGSGPAVPSRLLQRIAAFVGVENMTSIEQRGAKWVHWARQIDHVPEVKEAVRPQPSPPADQRPRSLSITDVEALIYSPYDLYAKYVLGLRKLGPLGDDPDARERGTLIHEILGQFVQRQHDVSAPDAYETLMAIALENFQTLEALPARRTLWLERFKPVARGFLDYERARAPQVRQRHGELAGHWDFSVGGEIFTLRGRADRVDELADGSVELIDFKTGAVPEPKQMRELTAPQLLLEAAMVEQGVFSPVPSLAASALTYIKIGAGPEAFIVKPFAYAKESDIQGAIEATFNYLQRQIEAYLLHDDLPMAARTVPKPKQNYAGDYDHLARTGEWTLADEGEGEE